MRRIQCKSTRRQKVCERCFVTGDKKRNKALDLEVSKCFKVNTCVFRESGAHIRFYIQDWLISILLTQQRLNPSYFGLNSHICLIFTHSKKLMLKQNPRIVLLRDCFKTNKKNIQISDIFSCVQDFLKGLLSNLFLPMAVHLATTSKYTV